MKNKYKYLKYIFSFILAFFFIFPIIWMIFVSLQKEGYIAKNIFDYFSYPYSLSSYIKVFLESNIVRWIFNSLIVSVSVTFLVLLFDSMAAYALSIMKFKYKNAIFTFFVIGLLIPGEANIVALFNIIKGMGLVNTYQALILPALGIPIGVIILKEFFDRIPRELVDSANIDGCGYFKIYYLIFMPLSKGALSAVGIFTFLSSWNSFLWPFLATMSKEMFTLPVGIPTYLSTYTVDFVRPMTINTIASIPAIIVFLIFQKKIIEGIKFSGIKG